MKRNFLRDGQDGYTKNTHIEGKEGVRGDAHVDFTDEVVFVKTRPSLETYKFWEYTSKYA